MSFHIVRFDDVVPQPWKNGGGVTRELLAWPTVMDWDVRISVADVENEGPFSLFPGIKRTITVISGAGIRLLEPHNVDLRPKDAPYTFASDVALQCELVDGATRDLNAMFRMSKGEGSMWRWRTGYESKLKYGYVDVSSDLPTLMGIFSKEGAELRWDGKTLHLPAMSLAWIDQPIRRLQVLSSPQTWAFQFTANR
jgi:uncharacterized protein